MIGAYVENNGGYSTLYAANHGGGAAGTFMGSLYIVDGTQGAGKVLTSNANGFASWQPVSINAPLLLSGTHTEVIKGTHTNGNHGAVGTSSEGVYGRHNSGCYGMVGTTSGMYAMHSNGNCYGHMGDSYRGVYGSSPSGYGIAGYATSGTGVFGYSFSGKAGYFNGDVDIDGTLSKTAGSFKIDHPLDPANKYLYHSFVASHDMMNIYNGNITLNQNGEAIVELPDYFKALNSDFRYQLTPIGAPGPDLFIAEEISENRFKIAGGAAGMKVSWQVTGIRQDAYAKAHRIQTEVDKEADKKGKYLHPKEHGISETMGYGYEVEQEMKAAQKKNKIEHTRRLEENSKVMKK